MVGFLAKLDRLDDRAFGHLVGAGLYHHHGVVGAGDDKIQVTLLALSVRGVNEEFLIDVSHADRADGTRERRLGDRERNRGANGPKHVQVILSVRRKDGDDHLDVVAEALGEERADRPVCQAAGQDGIGSGPAFTTEEAAGDFADRIEPLFKVNCEREKVDPRSGLVADNADGQEHGVSVTDSDCPAGEAGEFADLEDEGFPSNDAFKLLRHRRQLSSSTTRFGAGPDSLTREAGGAPLCESYFLCRCGCRLRRTLPRRRGVHAGSM